MFPAELQEAIEQKAGTLSLEALRGHAQNLSERYRYQSGQGRRLLTRDDEAQAYALVRMPATYAAVEAALDWSLACCSCRPRTLLDCGAGTGAASWAASSVLELDSVSCLEREEAMRHTG